MLKFVLYTYIVWVTYFFLLPAPLFWVCLCIMKQSVTGRTHRYGGTLPTVCTVHNLGGPLEKRLICPRAKKANVVVVLFESFPQINDHPPRRVSEK